jgi:hypothetical protein
VALLPIGVGGLAGGRTRARPSTSTSPHAGATGRIVVVQKAVVAPFGRQHSSSLQT